MDALGAHVGLAAPTALLTLAIFPVWALWGQLNLIRAFNLGKYLVLPLLLLAGRLLKGMLSAVDPPAGLPIDADTAPDLFRVIERVAGATATQIPDTVLLTTEFNAAVAQIPATPLLPIFDEYLVLGLPLLASCTPQEFEAVLAHEFGHLAGEHGKLSTRVYRVRSAWNAMAEHLSGPLGGLLRWFLPRYNAQTFVLARQQEVEADRLAARLTSPRILGDALVRIVVEDVVQDEGFWTHLRRRAQHEPDPPLDTFTSLTRTAPALGNPAQRERALRRALSEDHDVADTHPSLTERLESLGVEPRLPPPLERSAAQALLGDTLPELTAEFDAHWREQVAQQWSSAHEQAAELRSRLAELEARHGAGETDAALEMGILYRALGREGSALQALTRAHARAPDDPTAQFHLGRLMVELGDDAGLDLLDHARAADQDFELEATRLIYLHHLDAGEAGAAMAAEERERLERAYAADRIREEERSTLELDDELVPAKLGPEDHSALVEAMREGQVKAAWIAAKVLQHSPGEHLLVIAVAPDDWGDDPESSAARAEASFECACAAIRIDTPWLALSVPKHPELAKYIQSVAGPPFA